MRWLSFRHQGQDRFGVLLGDNVVALDAALGLPDLKAAVAADALGRGRALSAAADASDVIPLDRIALLPVIPNPDKIFCVGLNYRTHVAETGRSTTEHPVIFVRVSASQIGHAAPILVPTAVSHALDFEGELAVIIGRGGHRIRREDAMAHVAGYSCYNDATVRDWQLHTSQYTPGKNFAATGAFGPWMVGIEDVPDVEALELTTRLNGEIVQKAKLSQLIFPIPDLIAYLSTFIPLEPGDVVATGTPGGVGFKRTPPLFMKSGDEVIVEIPGVGTLRNPVADEALSTALAA